VDELCLDLLALRQAEPVDLRFITTAMKITHDLERIGDHAVNIAERALELNEEPPLPPFVDLPFMAWRAQEMVRAALDAFVARDGQMARDVIELDQELDRRMEQIFRAMLKVMHDDAATISRALRTTFVAKYFERIGDQATNICEQTVFVSEARVIKHSSRSSSEETATNG
ncbi:phosphate signaling complex protein PhoU, partial [bacterium]|nr:phosphate signaling complex protein PhoU [bacterium]